MDDFTLDISLPIINPEHFDLGITSPMEEGPLEGPSVCVEFLPQDEEANLKFVISRKSLIKLLDFVNRHKEEVFNK